MQPITQDAIARFSKSLARQERAPSTIRKYVRTVSALAAALGGAAPDKRALIAYRDGLLTRLSVQTVNGHLSAINAYLACSGSRVRLGLLKYQRPAFTPPGRELDEGDYRRLLEAARQTGDQRLYHVMLTLACTGIRVGELAFITAEALARGQAEIRLKGKTRLVVLPRKLRRVLGAYARSRGIAAGPLFTTRSGRPLDRSNICHDMKRLSRAARVDSRKVFPHNFRHLFARAFYRVDRDMARLADVLGHSRLETTRIYLAASAADCERTLSKMKLLI